MLSMPLYRHRDSIDGRDGRLDEKDTIYGVYVTGATTVYNIVKDDIQKVTTNKIKFGDTCPPAW